MLCESVTDLMLAKPWLHFFSEELLRFSSCVPKKYVPAQVAIRRT